MEKAATSVAAFSRWSVGRDGERERELFEEDSFRATRLNSTVYTAICCAMRLAVLQAGTL
jgi:hypothetical protein